MMRSIMTSVSSKVRETILGPSIKPGGHLVACFTLLGDQCAHPIFYKFEFYPIQRLITKSTTTKLLKPDAEFTWSEEMDNVYKKAISIEPYHWRDWVPSPHTRTRVPPYCNMQFLKVGDLVYAIGGNRVPQQAVSSCYSYKDEDLPQDLSCISLSASLQKNSEVKVQTLCPMSGTKYQPVVAEIGGHIYVLSSPSYQYPIKKPLFEVYNPSKDEWASLPDPPLLNPVIRTRGLLGLSSVVIGARLYVSSSDRGSCFYDTELKTWEACQLFSDIHMKGEDNPKHIDARCGRRFPFIGNPILYKEKFLLATGHGYHSPVLAYYILHEHKAVEVPFEFDTQIPPGRTPPPVIDLGDDYFVLMLNGPGCTDDDDDESRCDATVVTFKLHVETNKHGGFNMRGIVSSIHKMKTRIGNPFNGGKVLNLKGGFMHHHPSH